MAKLLVLIYHSLYELCSLSSLEQSSAPAIESITFELPTCIDNITIFESVAVEIDGMLVPATSLDADQTSVTVVETLDEGATAEYCLFFDADFVPGDNRQVCHSDRRLGDQGWVNSV